MRTNIEQVNGADVCNLYSMTKSQAAIRDIVRAIRDITGNMPPLPGIFPDYPAPIVRNAPDGVRELIMARWGMPAPTSRRPSDHQHSQRKVTALAAVAWPGEPLRRTVDIILRVRGHETKEDADLVCARWRPPARIFCGRVVHMARQTGHEGQSSRG
jgi:hypothetical protein